MTKATPLNTRLREAHASADPREALASQLLSQLGTPALSPSARVRVGAHLDELADRQALASFGGLRWAVAAFVAIGASGAIAATGLPARLPPLLTHLEAALLHAPSRVPAARAPQATPFPAVSPAPVVAPPAAPMVAPAAALSVPAAPVAVQRREPATKPLPADPLLADAKQLRAALELRQRGDLPGAVAALAQFRAAHPSSALAGEATLAELDGDLNLGRRAAALSLLDGLVGGREASDLPRAAELHQLRGELLAREGRCAEALPEFERSIESSALGERALFGRATCRQTLGETEASRRDYEALVAEYPGSALSAQARHALGEAP